MRLLELLKLEQKRVRLADSPEYAFFMANRHLLVDHNVFLDFYNLEDSFAIIQANIILKGILNKTAIETRLGELGKRSESEAGRVRHHDIRAKLLAEKLDMPVFTDQDRECYVPIFNRAMNYIYAKEPDKLFDFPYNKLRDDFANSVVNPFETYNFAVYDSNFTRLLKLGEDRTSMAFYHLDFNTLYVVNRQGSLDVSVALFDRHLSQSDEEGIVDRLLPAVNAYFSNDRDGFVSALLEAKLISRTVVDRFYDQLSKEEKRRYRL